jgi:hypothetical protein
MHSENMMSLLFLSCLAIQPCAFPDHTRVANCGTNQGNRVLEKEWQRRVIIQDGTMAAEEDDKTWYAVTSI